MLGCNTANYKINFLLRFTLYFDVLNVDLFFFTLLTYFYVQSLTSRMHWLRSVSLPMNVYISVASWSCHHSHINICQSGPSFASMSPPSPYLHLATSEM